MLFNASDLLARKIATKIFTHFLQPHWFIGGFQSYYRGLMDGNYPTSPGLLARKMHGGYENKNIKGSDWSQTFVTVPVVLVLPKTTIIFDSTISLISSALSSNSLALSVFNFKISYNVCYFSKN